MQKLNTLLAKGFLFAFRDIACGNQNGLVRCDRAGFCNKSAAVEAGHFEIADDQLQLVLMGFEQFYALLAVDGREHAIALDAQGFAEQIA